MAVLLLADHDNQTLSETTARAVSAAKAMGGDITVLVAGEGCRAVAGQASSLNGVSRVLHADAPVYAHRLAEPLADLLVGLAADYDHIVAPASTTGKNVLPRVAALLDVMIIADVIGVTHGEEFVRPIYAGNAIQTVRSAEAKKVVSVRATAFEPAAADGLAPVETLARDAALATASSVPTEWVADTVQTSDRPELGSAKIVISGGRGLGSKENFDMLARIADRMGAALGASRAAVDAGFAPNDLQVGQTGKAVAPDLYIAVGISGAIQHLAGMKDSKIIVAINKDAEAPIFQVADYGLVADLFEVLPDFEAGLMTTG